MFFGGVRSEVNKWQNRQSQSRFGPPDTALHRHVLQLEPYDASPWLFSVNSALSRPSILPSCLMSQQSLRSQPPSPSYLYNPSTVYCRYTVFFFFSFLWSKGEIAVYFTKQKLHLSVASAISLETLSWKERWAMPLSSVHAFVVIACERTPCTWLSTSQMLTGHFPFHSDSFFYCSFTNLREWRLHYGKMVCILAYSMAVRPLYHSDGLVKSRLVDCKCFLSDQQARPPVRDKKDRGFIDRDTVFSWDENRSVKTVWGKDVLPISTSSIIDLLFPQCSAGVPAFSSCCIQSKNISAQIFLFPSSHSG